MAKDCNCQSLIQFDSSILFIQLCKDLSAVAENGWFAHIVKLEIFSTFQANYLMVSRGCRIMRDTSDPIASLDASRSISSLFSVLILP